MTRRVGSFGDSLVRRSLSAFLDLLGKRLKGLAAQPLQQPPSCPEDWLVDRLVHTAGLHRDDVLALTSEQAVDAWTAHVNPTTMSSPNAGTPSLLASTPGVPRRCARTRR